MWIHVHTYTYVYIYIYIYIFFSLSLSLHIYIYTHTYTYMYIYIYIYMGLLLRPRTAGRAARGGLAEQALRPPCSPARGYTQTHSYACVCIYICTCIHTCLHTYVTCMYVLHVSVYTGTRVHTCTCARRLRRPRPLFRERPRHG